MADMDNPRVSVVVPVYNGKKYITRCVRSIFTQSFGDLELICVDDGSTDGTRDVLARLEKMYPDRLRVVLNEENMGPGRSRDIGVREAAGEYLCFVDADDYLLPDYLEQYMAAIEAAEAASGIAGQQGEAGKKNAKGRPDVVIGGYRGETRDGRLAIHKRADNVWSAVTYVVCWSKLYRRSFVLDAGMEFGDFKCLEDMHFNLLGYMNHMRYAVIDYAGYIHCDNGSSITKNGLGTADNEVAACVKAVYDSLEKRKAFKSLSQTAQWTLQYAYAANMAYSLVVYAEKLKGGRRDELAASYRDIRADMAHRFPGCRRNPFFRGMGPAGETGKIRMGVAAFMGAGKLWGI
jgi:glycosyltransferase involved in cell wall biosynthesis